MKVTKTTLSVFLVALLLMSMSGLASAQTDLTFWVIESFTPAQDAALYRATEQFNAANPDINVEVVPVPASVIRQNFVNASFGGGGPDVTALDIAWVAEFAEMGLIQSITDRFAAIEDRFFEGPATTGVYLDEAYAVPWYTNNVGLYYNVDMLAEVGYDAPPKNWDEFLEVSLALKDAGYHSLSLARSGFGIFMWLPFLYQNEGMLVYPDGNHALDTEEAFEAFKFFTDLHTVHGVLPESVKSNFSWSEVYAPFIQGRAAFVISGDWGIYPIRNAEPDFEWSVAPMPAGKRAATVIGGYNLAIGANSKNPDAAWKFIDFLTAEENLWILEEYNRISATAAVLDTEYATSNPLMEVFINQAAVGVARARVAEYAAITDLLGEAFDAVIHGVMDAETAWKNAIPQVEDMLR